MRLICQITIYLLIIAMLSCSHGHDSISGGETIVFGESDAALIDSLEVSFLQFEETDNSLIKSIGRIEQVGNRLIVGDDGTYRIMAFTEDGKFISNIGNRGEGPGEYIDFSSFFIKEDDNEIGVVDSERRKIIYYNLDDYSFKNECSYSPIASDCGVPAGDGMIWFNHEYAGDTNDSYFVVTDSVGKISNKFVPKRFISGYITGSDYPIYSLGDKIYGFTPYDMTLYELNPDSAEVRYRFEIDGFKTPTVDFLNEISENGKSNSLFDALSKSDFISYYDILETGQLICLTIIRQGQKQIALLDKNTDLKLFMPQDEFAKRLHLGKIKYLVPDEINDGLLAIIDKSQFTTDDVATLPDSLQQLINDDNSNPIVAIIRKR